MSGPLTVEPIPPQDVVSSALNSYVLRIELQDIAARRKKRGVDADDLIERVGNEETKPKTDLELVGLALSGGGIRSATFSLGVLQVLGEHGVLRFVDYLSTVSGGGYIGSFWSCLLARSRIVGNPAKEAPDTSASDPIAAAGGTAGKRLFAGTSRDNFWQFLTLKAAQAPNEVPLSNDVSQFRQNPLFILSHKVGEEEGPTFQRLRNYANYLMPRGLADAVRFPSLLLRGLLVNFLMVLPYILLFAAFTVWQFETAIKYGLYGFYKYFFDIPVPVIEKVTVGSPFTPWAFVAFLLMVTLSAIWQSLRRDHGLSDSRFRAYVLRLNTLLLSLVIVLALLEYLPKAIHVSHVGFQSQAEAKIVDSDFWSTVGVVVSGVGALLSTFVASRYSGLVSRLGVVLAGLLIPVALLLVYLTFCRWAVFETPAFLGLQPISFQVYAYVGLGLWVVSMAGLDVNSMSLHNYYRDSLSKSFLFSVRRNLNGSDSRSEIHDTLDYHDDLRLSEVKIEDSGGPYHIINAAWNNPDLDKVSLRGRRTDFFMFSPRYCGNSRLGYCSTAKLERIDKSADLGAALAISAAAAAPNMGQKTPNPLMVFLMAMLNIRLGYWLPSPNVVNRRWRMPLTRSSRVGPIYFFLELFGLTGKSVKRMINLSDGGHIENLGVFELLRRRCKFVIAVDAEADPEMTFNGLATAIRLARTDMGIDIDIDVDALRKDEFGLSRRHWVVGDIKYRDGEVGKLLYLKSSVTGTENEYVTEYRSRHMAFPHESTADQFFDEEQFEAYRALGYKVGKSLFRSRNEGTEDERWDDADKLFSVLHGRSRGSALGRKAMARLLRLRRQIERRLARPEFGDYAREIVGGRLDCRPMPMAAFGTDNEQTSRLLSQLCNEQFQLIEQGYHILRLDDPRNRKRDGNEGWMTMFEHWAKTATFQHFWKRDQDHYGMATRAFINELIGAG